MPNQMALVKKSALGGDTRRIRMIYETFERSMKANLHEIVVRRHPGALPKAAHEVVAAQASCLCEVVDAERRLSQPIVHARYCRVYRGSLPFVLSWISPELGVTT